MCLTHLFHFNVYVSFSTGAYTFHFLLPSVRRSARLFGIKYEFIINSHSRLSLWWLSHVLYNIQWPPKFNYRFNALHIKPVPPQLIFYANAGANKLLYSKQFLNVIGRCANMCDMFRNFFVCFEHKNRSLKERNQFTSVVLGGVQGAFINAIHAFPRE